MKIKSVYFLANVQVLLSKKNDLLASVNDDALGLQPASHLLMLVLINFVKRAT